MAESLCPEHDKRAAMTDEEFWQHVFQVDYEGWTDFDGPTDGDVADESCSVCGERGACGYDAEGRPMIHTVQDDAEVAAS